MTSSIPPANMGKRSSSEQGLDRVFFGLTRAFAIGIGLILYISPQLTLVMLSVIPIIIIVAVVFGKKIRSLSREAQDQLADSNIIVQETLQGISSVKAFSNEWFEINRYNKSLNKVVQLAISNGKVRGFSPLINDI